VHGLIEKSVDPAWLSKAIHLVVAGQQFTSPTFQAIKEEWLTKPEAFQKILTNRELAVLIRLTEGLSDPDIGQHLGISAETVACHRKSLRRKLELHDDRSLMAYGREWGIYGTGCEANPTR
jgi:DNA-binding NarL/FixJ family response regulator